MELINGRPGRDFIVGTYTYSEIKELNFMAKEEKRAREELKHRGYELAYIKADSECNGMFVRAYRVYTDKAPSNV